jgi:hypothetical protein
MPKYRAPDFTDWFTWASLLLLPDQRWAVVRRHNRHGEPAALRTRIDTLVLHRV